MANYTVTTGAPLETALDFVLTRVNAERAARTPPDTALAKSDLVTVAATREILRWFEERRLTDKDSLMSLAQSATPAQLAAIRTILGG